MIGGPRFTHVAGYHAGIVIRNALFRLPAKVDYAALPWVTYTDPELAQIGMTEADARQRYGEDVVVIRLPFAENDRAQAEREHRRNGKGRGAPQRTYPRGLYPRRACRRTRHLWVLAIEQGLKLKHIAAMLAPYPTWGEASKMAAVEFYKPRLLSPWTRRVVRALTWLP